MGNKKNRPNLQGIEHLYQELEDETSTTEVSNDFVTAKNTPDVQPASKEKSNLKKELVIIIIIMAILFGVLAFIFYLDQSNDFLRILAEKLTNLY